MIEDRGEGKITQWKSLRKFLVFIIEEITTSASIEVGEVNSQQSTVNSE
jgi:hypothetical protein